MKENEMNGRVLCTSKSFQLKSGRPEPKQFRKKRRKKEGGDRNFSLVPGAHEGK
jgi:hypothetical protein